MTTPALPVTPPAGPATPLTAAGVPDLTAVLAEVVDRGHPLLFATVSGAHLYGFASRDSDVDLRGVHLLPLREVIGLREGEHTQTRMWDRDGLEMDLVTHDVLKFARLMLRRNGYVLEQLLSPLVVHTTPVHAELAALAPGVLTRDHAHHYRGFARTQWRLFQKNGELKPLLYTFRVLLTGIHLMRTGDLEAHLPTLLDLVDAPDYVPALIERKAEAEHGPAGVEPERVEADVLALHGVLDEEQTRSSLPQRPTGYDALHDLVVRTRAAA
ncbi:nucleotidyltransferase domain-containing protein [Actinacidiphila acidipaludis]|uniref:Nucleotidyltransferase domain-containing protein n=1 Tax=Actinacidiphila acidipaludis TaxID=2873382 RepID=A0ABS7Q737_9ACTN|nr:nucleotidyltransferase domain-containing protein [Streptomyces acidipaludis]MBY8878539.1 nucleotidyltransferase domain-containing protein [Streptomyces acidipaludis]